MDTNKLTVTSLFQFERRYLVPLFQRKYVWTLDEHCRPLWEDIIEQVEVLRRHAQAASRREPRMHFLGAVVFSQAPHEIGASEAMEVIDGQQRLTTLQVLLAAMRDALRPAGNEYVNDQLRQLTSNPRRRPTDGDLVFKVWPTNADRDVFRDVMMSGSKEALAQKYPQTYFRRKPQPRPALVVAYEFFYDRVLEFTQLDEQPAEGEREAGSPSPQIDADRAEELHTAVANHLRIVGISLGAEDDPQVIFESLNGRGAPLEPSDLVRNFVFLSAARQGADVERLYRDHWLHFETDPNPSATRNDPLFWKSTIKQGRLKRSRLDLFLFHYLTRRLAREVRVTHLFQEFKEWWQSPPRDGAAERSAQVELESLQQASGVFRRLVFPTQPGRFEVLASRLKTLDISTMHPLLLFAAEREATLPAEEFEGILTDLESYIVRRAVCGFETKNYNRTFVDILRFFAAEGAPAFSREAVRGRLLQFVGDSVVWPDDARFGIHFVSDPLYQSIGYSKVAMILGALDLALADRKQEIVHLSPGTVSVEHLMPQSVLQFGSPAMEVHYPLPEIPSDSPPEATAERFLRRTRVVHSVGNLTLITGYLNSSVGNGPFAVKKQEIIKFSKLNLNRFLHDAPDKWDEEAIAARASQLLTVALKIWPHPGTSITA